MPDRAPRFSSGRHAGVLVPLFSIPSRRSWGIGEIPDLVLFGRWLRSAGLDFVQLLPMNEMQEGQSSPYSALSAMAIDPIYIALDEVDEWVEGEEPDARETWHREGDSVPRVDYAAVRVAKSRALRTAFGRFADRLLKTGDPRVRALRSFEEREAWWLADYALFRALHDAYGGRHWREWDPGVRDRDPGALADARARLDRDVRYYSYLQWIADEQWQRARSEAAPVGLFGDFPFMVSGHSADVWSRQQEFDLDASVGTPPDAFSEAGQDWGLPAYRWDVVEATGDAWLRARARRSRRALRRFPDRSPDRVLSDVRSQGRSRTRLSARWRARAARDGGAAAVDVRGERRDDRRRGPGHGAGFPARDADGARASRHEGHALGASVARGRAAVPRSVVVRGEFGRDERHARHRDDGRMVGRPGGRRPAGARRAAGVRAVRGRERCTVFGSREGRAARGALRLRLEHPDPSAPGHLRVARSDQRARGRR